MFQFHYGSIKIRVKISYRHNRKTKFQFHYGSIKISASLCSADVALEFQFHYGSIKINQCGVEGSGRQQFQFHYGSIKISTKTETQQSQMSFNSTMVRLKCIRY